jgi:putative transposase
VSSSDHQPSVERAVLAEQTDEWTEQRRYMGIEILAKARQAVAATTPQEVAPPTAISA